MDKREAEAILERELARYRDHSFTQLRALLSNPRVYELVGPSGARYQLEVQAVWDGPPGGPIRVLASIDDGGWRAIHPLTVDFIKDADGTFVGE